MTEELRDVLAMKDEDGNVNRRLIAEKIVELAKGGNVKAIEDIFDRLDGRPPQTLEHTGPDGGVVRVVFGGDDASDQ